MKMDTSSALMKISIDQVCLPRRPQRLLLMCIVLLVFSTPALCTRTGQAAENNPLELPPAPLPNYQVGTKFVYSDGTWETVKEVGVKQITWVNHRKQVSVGTPDFTYKRGRWETSNRYGFRRFTQAIFLDGKTTTTLWPLEVGNRSRYEEFGRWYNQDGIEQRYDLYWSCEVKGTEKISVAAGDFDTWKITCRRYPNKFRTASRTREYRTWYYAPSINHWVLENRDYNGYKPNQRKELVAVMPDMGTFTTNEADRTSMQQTFQNTLEENKDQETAIWENFNQQLVIGITPLKSFTHPSGNRCRQYHQVIAKDGVPFEFPGIACKDPDGRWVVPRR
jgi:surface antigen